MSTAERPPDPPTSLLQTLIEQPGRFSFDAAIAVLMQAAGRGDVSDTIRFQVPPGLANVMRDVLAVSRQPDGRFAVTVGFTGLTGPGGVLPRPYSETVITEHRRRSSALAAFLDMLAQRPLAQFAMAGAKYHVHRQLSLDRRRTAFTGCGTDPVSAALLALTGHASPRDVERSGFGAEQLLHFAAFFSTWPRSVDRLAALLDSWAGAPVAIEQFVGAWLPIDPVQRTALPGCGGDGRFNRLGVDAAIGYLYWDIQSRIRIVIGPVDWATFQTLMPGGERLEQLNRLVRTYLDGEVNFSVNVVLRPDAIASMRLGQAGPDGGPRLGWNGWLPVSQLRRDPVRDAIFYPKT